MNCPHSTLVHSSNFHKSLEQRCGKPECGRIYELVQIPYTFFQIHTLFNIPQIVEKWTVEEYMYSSTLHIHVIVKSIYPHSLQCLYYSTFIYSSILILPNSTILFHIPQYSSCFIHSSILQKKSRTMLGCGRIF